MEEYNRIDIQQICSNICSGGTPKSTIAEYYGGNIPWLNTKEINFNRIYETEKTITEEGLNNSSAKWIPANSVIVAMYGATAGKTAITHIPLTTNQACCNLTINSDKADYRFVYYALFNDYSYLASLANGGAQQNLNAQQIKEFEIPFPSLEEQKRIADILSSLDDKIELNRRINDNLEQQAQALFKDWCDGCTETVEIGQIATNVLDYTPNRNKQVRLINSSDITEGIFGEYPLVENINLKGHFKKRFKKGDILYSEIRPRNHHYGYVLFDGDEYVISTRLMVIRNIPNMVSAPVLYQYLLLPEVEEHFVLKTESRSGTFPQGSYTDLATIRVPFAREQNNITNSLDKIRQKIYSSQRENHYLTALRDALLPKLMSGELKIDKIGI